MHHKIDVNCKNFVFNLVKHVKICCLAPIKFSSEAYFEVIFNESIYYHLLQKEKIKIDRSTQDKCFFDSLIRTQLFSNLICSYFEADFETKHVDISRSAGCTNSEDSPPATGTLLDSNPDVSADQDGSVDEDEGSAAEETFAV